MRTGGDQPLTAVRDAPVGGQAVLEGVMMRGVRNWAVAVREPLPEAPEEAAPPPSGDVEAAGQVDAAPVFGNIAVRSFPLNPAGRRSRVFRLPVIRGVAALIESLGIGLRALSI